MPQSHRRPILTVLATVALFLGACQPAPAPPAAAPKTEAKPTEPQSGPTSVPNPAAPAASPAASPSPGASPVAAAPAPSAAQPGPDIVIGVNLELSGPASVWGQPELNAITLLVDSVNAKGGINGSMLKIIAYDNESNEGKSLVNVKRLIEEDKVIAVVGAGTTPATMSTLPAATESQVPMISIGSSNAIVEPVQERKWIFKTPSNSRDVARRMIQHMQTNNIAKVGFLSVNNAYGDAGVKEFGGMAKQMDLDVLAWEKFGATDTDMKPQLTKLRAMNPDAIVTWAIPPAASIVDRNYKELGLTIPLYHDHGATSWDYQALSGDANDGAFIVTAKSMIPEQLPDSDPVKAVALAYKQEYEAKFDKRAGGNDAMTYDAMLLLTKALEKSGPDRGKLRDAIEGLQNVVGASGVFTMSPTDHNGIADKDLVVVQVKDGAWNLVK
jgi:branched-chain amino acid transport system substrate-binding protein